MILVLCDGSILLKSSGGSSGMGSPQYGQLSISAPTGIPHVSQVTWSGFSFLFTGLGLKHMVVSSPSHARSSKLAASLINTSSLLPPAWLYERRVSFVSFFWLDCNCKSNTARLTATVAFSPAWNELYCSQSRFRYVNIRKHS